MTQQFQPHEIENRYSNKNLCMTDQVSTIHNKPKVETTQMSIHGWLDKRTVVSPYNGMFFSYTKEWSAAPCYGMDESGKHGKLKMPGTKDHMLCDPTYMQCPERGNLYEVN